jgi:uncharacterized damage-inducible protein DinB
MSPEEAGILLHTFLSTVQQEMQTTLRVLKAIPAGKTSFRPHPDSRSALELAWHTASADVWFLEGFQKGEFLMEDDTMPADLGSGSDIACWYEDAMATNLDKIRQLPATFWATPLPFFGIYNLPAVMYLQFMILHTVHHRGQLTAYLRPMGAKVPNIYGGSFDEPMNFDSSLK